MFEGYTEKARRIIFFARYEAAQVGASNIEPEHLLLGLLRESHDLITPPVDLDDLVHELRASMQPAGAKISTSVDLPLSDSSRLVLAYSVEEAERLNDKHIAPEHLLLALTRESGTPAAEILRKHEFTAARVRERIGLRGGNEAIVHALRETFTPMASRLTGEVEPAVTFGLKPGDAA
jgi:ATP-dependent Clp protease ATP-binding subunit ClpC